MSGQDTISAQEMAERLGVRTQTIYNYIDRGFIPAKRVRRGIRYRLVVLRADFEVAVPKIEAMGDAASAGAEGFDLRKKPMDSDDRLEGTDSPQSPSLVAA